MQVIRYANTRKTALKLWCVISILQKDICLFGNFVEKKRKKPWKWKRKQSRTHVAKGKLQKNDSQTSIEYLLGKRVGSFKIYIQILWSKWIWSIWGKRKGKLAQRMMSLSALPDTQTPDILAAVWAVILIYRNAVYHFASRTNIYRESNEWMKRNSCDSFQLIAHFISQPPPQYCLI